MRTRTTAETPTLPDLTQDRLESYSLRLNYDHDTGAISKDGSYFEYEVANINENGKVAGSQRFRVNITDMPTALRTQLKALRDAVMTHAEAQGYIGAGTDSEDLDP